MSANLTKIPGVPDSATAIPGMAFFSGTGPVGKTCGSCKYRGYSRESSKGHYNEITNETIYHSHGVRKCAMFLKLTGKHGADIDKDNSACKYYEPKK